MIEAILMLVCFGVGGAVGFYVGTNAARALQAKIPAYENDRAWLRRRARRASKLIAKTICEATGKPHLMVALQEPSRRLILDSFDCPDGRE